MEVSIEGIRALVERVRAWRSEVQAIDASGPPWTEEMDTRSIALEECADAIDVAMGYFFQARR